MGQKETQQRKERGRRALRGGDSKNSYYQRPAWWQMRMKSQILLLQGDEMKELMTGDVSSVMPSNHDDNRRLETASFDIVNSILLSNFASVHT